MQNDNEELEDTYLISKSYDDFMKLTKQFDDFNIDDYESGINLLIKNLEDIKEQFISFYNTNNEFFDSKFYCCTVKSSLELFSQCLE